MGDTFVVEVRPVGTDRRYCGLCRNGAFCLEHADSSKAPPRGGNALASALWLMLLLFAVIGGLAWLQAVVLR